MRIKYSLNDVLLEAGVLDYRQIETDGTWSPSSEHIRSMKKIYKKEKDGRFTPLVKLLYGVAAAALLFIIIVSVKPVREGVASFFNGLFGSEPVDTVTSGFITEPEDTETEQLAAGKTEAETERKEPQTDEEKIAAIIDDIIENGFTNEKWAGLKSYGDQAYLYCVDTYFNTKCDNVHKTVYSVLCMEFAEREIRLIFPDYLERYKDVFTLSSDVLSDQPTYMQYMTLQRFRDIMEETVSAQIRKLDMYTSLHYTDLMLDLLDFSYYRAGSPDTPPEEYNPRNKLIEENVAYLNVHGLKAYKQSFAGSVMIYDKEISDLLDIYLTGDEKTKAAASVLLAMGIQSWDSEYATQAPRMKLSEFFGEEGYAYLLSINEEELKNVDENTDLSKYANWTDNFIVYLKEAASKQPEYTVKQDREICYQILNYFDFNGYYVSDEFENKTEGVIREFLTLYGGVMTGSIDNEQRDEKRYSNYPGAQYPLTDELKKAIKEYLPDYDKMSGDLPLYKLSYSTLKGDLKTVDGWRKRFTDVVDNADLAYSLARRENVNHLIIDGEVYLIMEPAEGGYFVNPYIQPGSVNVIERGYGFVVISADIRWNKDKSETHTFYVTSDGEPKLLWGGSFFDSCVEE